MFGGRDDPDPFGFGFGGFNHVHRQMHDMDRMMGAMMDPFDMLGMRRGPPPPRHMIQRGPPPPHPMDPFGMMMNPFGGFGIGGMFNTMNQMQQHAMNSPDSMVFTQSTMMTFDEDGNPRVVKKSMRKAGDAREERRMVRDGDREEMEIGHSLGDRTHVIMKKRDKDGLVREQQRFVNLDEAVAQDFDSEFQSRVRSNFFGGPDYSRGHRAIGGSSSQSRRDRSNPNPRQYRESSSADAPIITLPEEEVKDNGRERPSSSRSSRHQGPVIREISEEEAESSISKKRRGPYGMF